MEGEARLQRRRQGRGLAREEAVELESSCLKLRSRAHEDLVVEDGE
jgi:hypothetical protein